tara:strand:+ start:165 stop:491 length:327 start_codon:yes stop_codon:yes gene_type:complete
MSWKKEIKKAKYQGPPSEMSRYATMLTPTRLKEVYYHFNELEKKLADLDDLPVNTDYLMENIRRALDKIDDELENEAKYGDARGKRADEKFIGNYTIKPRKDKLSDEE